MPPLPLFAWEPLTRRFPLVSLFWTNPTAVSNGVLVLQRDDGESLNAATPGQCQKESFLRYSFQRM
jgi:hypothetical protein